MKHISIKKTLLLLSFFSLTFFAISLSSHRAVLADDCVKEQSCIANCYYDATGACAANCPCAAPVATPTLPSTPIGGIAPLPSVPAGMSTQYNSTEDLLNRACELLGYVFSVLVFASIAMGLYAGFLYVTSSGDPEKAKKSNRILLYASIAIALAIIARGFPWMVSKIILQADPTGPGISNIKSKC